MASGTLDGCQIGLATGSRRPNEIWSKPAHRRRRGGTNGPVLPRSRRRKWHSKRFIYLWDRKRGATSSHDCLRICRPRRTIFAKRPRYSTTFTSRPRDANGHAEGAPFEHYGPIQSDEAIRYAGEIVEFVRARLARPEPGR